VLIIIPIYKDSKSFHISRPSQKYHADITTISTIDNNVIIPYRTYLLQPAIISATPIYITNEPIINLNVLITLDVSGIRSTIIPNIPSA
jgi:hypothetical protein